MPNGDDHNQSDNNDDEKKRGMKTSTKAIPKALIVGISGCSSSGKTTLSRLLRDIFPSMFILHEDDFYRAEVELPTKNGLLDWDCAEALDIPQMQRALDHIRREGEFPPDLDSKEDQNSVGECPVSSDTIAELKATVSEWVKPGGGGAFLLDPQSNPTSSLPPSSSSSSSSSTTTSPLRICLFDGFLLYADSMAEIQDHLDIKIFLRVSYAKAKARREARTGYVTLEGFWEDPPGYVDKIVWPNYVADHAWLFEDGDVEGVFKEGILAERDLRVFGEKWKENNQARKNGEERGPEEGRNSDVDVGIELLLRWLVDLLMEELPKFAPTSAESEATSGRDAKQF